MSTLSLYRRGVGMLGRTLGNSIFSAAVCFKAPYFLTIRPVLLRLEPGHTSVRMRNSWLVRNHLGTVHAIAQCNLIECMRVGSNTRHDHVCEVGRTRTYLPIHAVDLRM
jgi:hypothetical protein